MTEENDKGWNTPEIKALMKKSDGWPILPISLGNNLRDDGVSLPSVRPISQQLDDFQKQGVMNKYDTYREMRRIDPELSGAIKTSASMIGRSYDGVFMLPSSPGVDLSDLEKQLLEEGRNFADTGQMNFKGLFVSIGDKLQQNGDFIALRRWRFGDTKLPLRSRYWKPLPLAALTAVETIDQIGNASAQIWDPMIYVLNENSQNQQTFDREKIIHISLNNYATETYDNYGRYTFGVWSRSMMESLETTIKWKYNTIQNDIKWRHMNVPRMHIKVNTSAFQPDKFDGATMDEKINKANAAAQTYMNGIRKMLEDPATEQGMLTDMDTVMDYVEPKTASYADPNLVTKQQNASISAATGIPGSLIGGDEKSFSSLFISSAFSTMEAELVSERIGDEMELLMREHLLMKHIFIERDTPDIAEILNRLIIKYKPIFLRDRIEQANLASTMKGTGAFNINEIRAVMGYDALGKDDLTALHEEMSKMAASIGIPAKPQTAQQVAEDIARREDGGPTIAPSEKTSSDKKQGRDSRVLP